MLAGAVPDVFPDSGVRRSQLLREAWRASPVHQLGWWRMLQATRWVWRLISLIDCKSRRNVPPDTGLTNVPALILHSLERKNWLIHSIDGCTLTLAGPCCCNTWRHVKEHAFHLVSLCWLALLHKIFIDIHSCFSFICVYLAFFFLGIPHKELGECRLNMPMDISEILEGVRG